MQDECEKLKQVVCDTISLLCQKGLTFYKFLKIEGVIGVSVDDNKFVIHIDQVFDSSTNVNTASYSELLHPNCIKKEQIKDTQLRQSIKHEPPDLFGNSQNQTNHLNIPHTFNNDQPSTRIFNNTGNKMTLNNSKQQKSQSLINTPPSTYKKSNALELFNSQFTQNSNGNSFKNSFTSSQFINVSTSKMKSDPVSIKRGTTQNFSMGSSKPRKEKEAQLTSQFGDCQNDDINNVNDEDYIITESTHICGYPNCKKRFKYRGDLLKHQTKNHNRIPTRKKKIDGGFDMDYEAGVSKHDNEEFIITESTHICGYPNCNKRFKYRGDLLKHQTKNHGRVPKRKKNNTSQMNDNDDVNGYDMDYDNYGQIDMCENGDYFDDGEQFENCDDYGQYQ